MCGLKKTDNPYLLTDVVYKSYGLSHCLARLTSLRPSQQPTQPSHRPQPQPNPHANTVDQDCRARGIPILARMCPPDACENPTPTPSIKSAALITAALLWLSRLSAAPLTLGSTTHSWSYASCLGDSCATLAHDGQRRQNLSIPESPLDQLCCLRSNHKRCVLC